MTHLPHFFHCDEWKCRQQNVSQDRQLKETKENPEQGSGQFVFAFKKQHITELLDFFFFLPLSSVTHSPVQPRYFGVFFSGKPVGGWLWRSQELTKYQQMLEPPKQRQTPPPTQGSFEKACWSAPTWADFPVLMRGISKSSSGAQAVRAAFLRTPPALCEARHSLGSQAYLVGFHSRSKSTVDHLGGWDWGPETFRACFLLCAWDGSACLITFVTIK